MEGTMMKTMLAGRFLVMTMLAGLLMPPLPVAQKEGQSEVLTQAVYQSQLVEGGMQTDANALLNPGPSDSYAMLEVVSEERGSLRPWTMLPLTAPQNLSRFTAIEKMPQWVWCLLHIRFCKNF
jgi:hypothetical protein